MSFFSKRGLANVYILVSIVSWYWARIHETTQQVWQFTTLFFFGHFALARVTKFATLTTLGKTLLICPFKLESCFSNRFSNESGRFRNCWFEYQQ
jgi:hypothetical protein